MTRRRPRATALALAATSVLAVLSAWSHAEVVARGPGGFLLVHELRLPATPDRAYRAITEEIGSWWSAEHTYSGDAASLSLDARAGGCFCEQLANGGSVEHMRVVFAAPGRRLRLSGGLGPLQRMGMSGSMEFVLDGAGDAASLLLFQYTVSGFTPDGRPDMAEPVDAMLREQLGRLAGYLEWSDR